MHFNIEENKVKYQRSTKLIAILATLITIEILFIAGVIGMVVAFIKNNNQKSIWLGITGTLASIFIVLIIPYIVFFLKVHKNAQVLACKQSIWQGIYLFSICIYSLNKYRKFLVKIDKEELTEADYNIKESEALELKLQEEVKRIMEQESKTKEVEDLENENKHEINNTN